MAHDKNIKHRFRPPVFIIYTMLAVLLLLLQACGSPSSAELSVGDRASDFSLPTSEGRTVSLSDYVGTKPTLLYFHMAVG